MVAEICLNPNMPSTSTHEDGHRHWEQELSEHKSRSGNAKHQFPNDIDNAALGVCFL